MLKLAPSKKRKVVTFEELTSDLEAARKEGRKIVQCHGVFDLLHPGHIQHFHEAKRLGDLLVVTLTPDRFVNKGPGRPVFNEKLRLDSLSALGDIDYVVLNDQADAVSAIQKVRPHYYVKGMEYSQADQDVTGKITEEKKAVEAAGGAIYYTDGIVFSSSSLLNQFFDPLTPQVAEFMDLLKKQYSSEAVLRKIEALSDLKVLVIGDAIIDEYQYANPLGQSGKGLHMVARCKEKETFLGGSLIIANHVAQYCKSVTLVSSLGKECPHLPFIQKSLDPRIDARFVFLDETTSLVKKRYVLKDGNTITKLFETYTGHEESLNQQQTQQAIQWMQGDSYDLVLVCDFGNGFTNPEMIHSICQLDGFLALNAQINSGNRGYNVITNYQRADYISVNEPELRLSAHDRQSSLSGLVSDISQIMNCQYLSVTQGVKGVYCAQPPQSSIQIPAFTTYSVDRIGAGDSYLALSSLCLAKGYPLLFSGFIGSVAAAMSVQMIGNQDAIKKIPLCKFLTRLMK